MGGAPKIIAALKRVTDAVLRVERRANYHHHDVLFSDYVEWARAEGDVMLHGDASDRQIAVGGLNRACDMLMLLYQEKRSKK